MNKPFVQKILAVVLGISLFVMLMSFVSLIFDAVVADDLMLISESYKELISFTKWTAVALVCTLVPTFVCYAFAFFAKSKIFSICSAVLSLFIAVCCIAFLFTAKASAIEGISASKYATVSGYFQEMLHLAIPALIACAYFVIHSVNLFKKTVDEPAEIKNEEI